MNTNTSLAQKTRARSPKTGINSLNVARAIYDFAVDGGAISTIIPKKTVTLPKNAVIVGGTINSTTAVTSAGSSTMSVGTSAGSSTTAILGATAKATMSANALINAVPVFATPVKLTAQGDVTVTIATASQTAGVVEITLYYYVADA
jgi:hypothetical protein